MYEDNPRLKEAIEMLDLEAWLDDYVDVKHGGGYERRLEICPKCGNDEYKLYVNIDHKHWICYVCGWGDHQADIVVLMSEISGRTLFDIRKELLQSVQPARGGDLIAQLEKAFTPTTPVLQVKPALPLPGTDQFTGVVAQRVLQYMRSRGLTDDEIGLYRLRAALTLRSKKLIGPYAVVPVMYQRACVGWQGRNITGREDSKYVSSDDIANWLWPIDDVFLAHVRNREVVSLVEGYYDAAGLWRIHEPSFCTFGKHISEAQVQLLKAFGVKTVRLAWDADAAQTSSKKLARMSHERSSKGLRGEIEEAALKLKRDFHVLVTDLSNPPPFDSIKKPDPGEILRVPEIGTWIQSRLRQSMDVNSLEFFQWRLG